MASAVDSAPRLDPYREFRFRVRWNDRHVAGFGKMSALKHSTEVVDHRGGGDPLIADRAPCRVESNTITLERGVTHDREFERWASAVFNYGSAPGAAAPLEERRSTVIVEILDEGGHAAQRCTFYRCWVSRVVALPHPDVSATGVAIESLVLESEGWALEDQATEPQP